MKKYPVPPSVCVRSGPDYFRTIRRAGIVIVSFMLLNWATALIAQNAASSSAEIPPGFIHKVLNPLDTGELPGLGAWKVSGVNAGLADGIEPRMGSAAVLISGQADSAGAKVDAPAFDGQLNDCQRLSLWVQAPKDANVESVGFQISDAQGEWLMQTVPLDWTGWKRIDIDPSAGGMKPAYAQKDKSGQVDLPLRSVHIIFFAKAAGPVSLYVDGLTAVVKADTGARQVQISPISSMVVEPGRPLDIRPVVQNPGQVEQTVTIRYDLQVNSGYVDPVVPDPVLGYDQAIGAKSTVTVDGVDQGDAKLTDDSDFTHYEPSWGGKYKEAVATIDLGQPRDVTAVHWIPSDANWIFDVDVSTSLDGKDYQPVSTAQNFSMLKQWGGPHAFPWPGPIKARYLRFRFHKNNGETSNIFRLPSTIRVYDGIANDKVSIPKTGDVLFSGTASVKVPARDFAELHLTSKEALGPGSYLLGMTIDIAGQKQVQWSHLFVAPNDTVPPERARRFGINSSAMRLADSMRRCGFGWIRFENSKWRFFALSPEEFAFKGQVKPWGVDSDEIFQTYHNQDMDVLPYVFQAPEWETSAPADVKQNRAGYPPKDNAQYGQAIFQLVARYGSKKVDPSLLKTQDKQSGMGLIQAVELWNEPNLNAPSWGPFVGTMAQYFEVMRAGVEGARRADPSLPISAAGFAGIDLTILGQLAEYHYADGKTPLDLVDIINGHFYSGRQDPEITGWDPNVDRGGPVDSGTTYPAQLADLVAWRDKLKPKAEIWITETGNDVGGPIGLDERAQAAKVPRVVMLALAAGIDKVFIYREAGSTPTQHAGAGLLRNDGSMRPSWVTVATMIRQLQGFQGRALRLPAKDPNVWMFLWEDGSRRVVSAWTLGDPSPLGVDLGKATVCDAFGRTTALDKTADVELSYFPVYITLADQTPALNDLVNSAREQLKQRDQRRRELSEMTLYLYDFGSAENVGMFKGFGPPRRFTAITKQQVWDDKAGYGFISPAISDNDRHWIKSAIDRDDCRIGTDNAFKMRLKPGQYTIQVNAAAVAKDPSIEVIVTADGKTQKQMTTNENQVAQFTITAGAAPVSISLGKLGGLRWITAVPANIQ